MIPHRIVRTALALVPLVAICATAQTAQPKFTVLNTASGIFLQMDVVGLSGSVEPRIDTIRVGMRDEVGYWDNGLAQVSAILQVTWSTIPLSVVGEAKITDAQITKRIEIPVRSTCPTCKDTVRAIKVDTIEYGTPITSAILRQVQPRHVNELSLTPRIHCVYDYMIPACDPGTDGCRRMLIQRFVDAWKAKAYAAIIEPAQIMTFVYVSPWSQTKGTEDFAGVVVPNAHNAANWIDVSRARFATRDIVKQPPFANPEPGITMLPVWNIPTGSVRYIYNRTASPELKILETSDHRTFGNLLKIGSTLEVSRIAKPRGCLAPIVDTTMGKSSWLVLADSASEGALEAALTPTEYPFGSERTSAWKISGDTVWLDQQTTIKLADLLAEARGGTRASRSAHVAPIRLEMTATGVALDLESEGSARIVGTDGRILSGWTSLPAGRSALDLPGNRLSIVQVRVGKSLETHPVVR